MRARLIGLFIVLAAVCFGSPRALAQGTDVLNPYSVRSVGGHAELHVRPSEMRGVGPCELTLRIDGEDRWTRTLEDTVWHAAVDDEGRVIAATFEYGAHGMRFAREEDRGPSMLTILVLDADGERLSAESIPRRVGGMHEPYTPGVLGAMIYPETVIGVVRVSAWQNETWHRFRLDTGEPLATVIPDALDAQAKGFRYSVWTRPIPGCPLVLQVWSCRRERDGTWVDGIRLALLNTGGNEIWSSWLEGEYGALDERLSRWDITDLMERQIAVSDRSFEFCSFKSGQATRFDIESEGPAWTVRETPEGDAGLPELASLFPEPENRPDPTRGLRELAIEVVEHIDLKDPNASAPVIDRVPDFSFDARGRIGVVARGASGFELRLIDPAGTLIKTLPLDFEGIEDYPRAVPGLDGAWLITNGEYEQGRVWMIDPDTGGHRLVAELREHRTIAALVALDDGGFAGVMTDRAEYSSEDFLVRYSAIGEELWSVELFSPEDVARTSRGELVVVDNIRDELLWFDLEGEQTRVTDLEAIFGSEMNYPCGVDADRDGGVWVFNQSGSPPFHRINAEGVRVATMQPALANGQRFGSSQGIKTGPDGAYWASDRMRITRLGENGVADLIIGEDPESDSLQRVATLGVGPDGTIYAINEASGVIHVFDSHGTQTGSRRGPANYHYHEARGLTVTHDGHAVVNFGGVTHRIGLESEFERSKPAMDEISEYRYPLPGEAGAWIAGYREVARLDANGQIARVIYARPNGMWIEHPTGGAVAPDGSFAFIAGGSMRRSDPHTENPLELCVYSPEGEPVAQLPALTGGGMWPGGMVFDPPYVLTATKGGLIRYDLRGGNPVRFSLPSADSQPVTWRVFPSPVHGEALVWKHATTELLRVKFPSN